MRNGKSNQITCVSCDITTKTTGQMQTRVDRSFGID